MKNWQQNFIAYANKERENQQYDEIQIRQYIDLLNSIGSPSLRSNTMRRRFGLYINRIQSMGRQMLSEIEERRSANEKT